ncbi:flagellar basal-body MS-ring/collar protein FliF [Nocardioides sp. BP30]|uniref:flagellar basal-body MS-ring/collar protein FliF n=1 Tax=Nocardioides sp. BP30 TaxID=3036374 RepID=UPI002468DA1C|nr:flagellar basal-body MS-ring/collar protein FliF [Nocardioides sp. BP30]WGL51933.1 flagellar basal-body MS-ring/collar protein FliF [Nocardioides sp. BP30]
MRENLTQLLTRYRRAFGEFSNGQKAVAIVGSGALLLAAFLVFRWVSAPTYAPLYTNLQSSDASSVIDELNKEGVKYKLAANGSTIEVPQNAVYSTRISLSGKNLPAGNSDADGYGLLDSQSLSTSDFQEQTDFKRAMEGELDKTLEAMTGIQTAVVHLAIPQKQVFSDQQDPTTASVLLQLETGTTLSAQQVQAVVHLVASSIDGLDPGDVTVTDQNGNVLSAPANADGTSAASTQSQQTEDFENDIQSEVQQVLDKVVGVGNATANVTANLNYDQKTTDTLTYGKATTVPSLSDSKATETYSGPASGASAAASGVVGPDGQMDSSTTTSGGNSTYKKESTTSDNGVDQIRQHIVTAPGAVQNIHVGVVMDSAAVGTIPPAQVQQLISSSIGINAARGDTIDVTTMPFNKTAAAAAAKELAAAQAAADHAKRMKLYRDLGIGAVVALIILLAWLRSRRRAKAREDATSYVVEQLRADAEARAAAIEAVSHPAVAALEAAEETEAENLRQELNQLVDSQPEDVATLLRGWLVERPR